jgi:hypothetical protein
MKSTWNIIDTERGRTRKQNDTQYLIENSCVQNPAETIDKYFLSLADKLAVLISSSLGSPVDRDFLLFMEHAIKSKYPKICINPVSTREIENIIYSFKNKDSYGYDEISLKVLKLTTLYISSPFSYICNSILQSGTFPERSKHSEVKPFHKKGDKQLISN